MTFFKSLYFVILCFSISYTYAMKNSGEGWDEDQIKKMFADDKSQTGVAMHLIEDDFFKSVNNVVDDWGEGDDAKIKDYKQFKAWIKTIAKIKNKENQVASVRLLEKCFEYTFSRLNGEELQQAKDIKQQILANIIFESAEKKEDMGTALTIHFLIEVGKLQNRNIVKYSEAEKKNIFDPVAAERFIGRLWNFSVLGHKVGNIEYGVDNRHDKEKLHKLHCVVIAALGGFRATYIQAPLFADYYELFKKQVVDMLIANKVGEVTTKDRTKYNLIKNFVDAVEAKYITAYKVGTDAYKPPEKVNITDPVVFFKKRYDAELEDWYKKLPELENEASSLKDAYHFFKTNIQPIEENLEFILGKGYAGIVSGIPKKENAKTTLNDFLTRLKNDFTGANDIYGQKDQWSDYLKDIIKRYEKEGQLIESVRKAAQAMAFDIDLENWKKSQKERLDRAKAGKDLIESIDRDQTPISQMKKHKHDYSGAIVAVASQLIDFLKTGKRDTLDWLNKISDKEKMLGKLGAVNEADVPKPVTDYIKEVRTNIIKMIQSPTYKEGLPAEDKQKIEAIN